MPPFGIISGGTYDFPSKLWMTCRYTKLNRIILYWNIAKFIKFYFEIIIVKITLLTSETNQGCSAVFVLFAILTKFFNTSYMIFLLKSDIKLSWDTVFRPIALEKKVDINILLEVYDRRPFTAAPGGYVTCHYAGFRMEKK